MLAIEFAIAMVVCAVIIAWWTWRERRKFPREADRVGRAQRYFYITDHDSKVHISLICAGGLGAFAMLLLRVWHIPVPWGSSLVFVAPIGVAYIYRTRRRRTIADDVRRRGYRLCPMCQYSLEGSPREGRCPECGQTYTRESLTNEWETSFRDWRW